MNKYCPHARTAKKMEEINNFQQEPYENLYQAWERFKELLMKCPQHYLTEIQETAADAKVAIQQMAEYSQKWNNGTFRSRSTETSGGLAAIQAQLNNPRREIKKVNEKVYAAQVGCKQCKGPHYTKDCPLKKEGKTLEEAYYTVGEERIIFTSVKPASSLIKRVYMLSLRERMELDLESRLMGESLVLNRSLYLFFEDYIELNDLNEPIKLRKNQGDDLMPTIKEGEVIKEFRTRDDELDDGIDDYPSYCDYDKKIHIDYKMTYKGNNVVGALMNVPIFVGTFSVVTGFVVLENIDAYRDEEMGDVIFGEPFLRNV
uniref:Retrotransposon gag domain-containing protein n=1 Tax=Tanacetum cinerariifolium TaxID=118510 RepID=A0A699HRS6_TANCI|nr:hypothetical protein [Tanacetum cinerariifolium]